MRADISDRASVNIISSEIARTELRVTVPRWTHLYAAPFLSLYPLFAYAYYIKYDEWIQSEEWTFLGCVLLGAGHALSFLVTRWNAGAKAWVTTRKVRQQFLPFILILNTFAVGALITRRELYPYSARGQPWPG